MEGIRLRNIRSLEDTGDLIFKPITLLIGKNSSGKSSVARSLPLVAQSVMTRANAPILWWGEFVDFGGVSEVKTRNSADDFVEIDLALKANRSDSLIAYYSSLASEFELIWLGLRLKEVDGRTRLDSFTIKTKSDFLLIKIDRRGIISSVELNGKSYTEFFPSDRVRVLANNIVPQIQIIGGGRGYGGGFYDPYRSSIDTLLPSIYQVLRSNLHGSTSQEKIQEIGRRIKYSSDDSFLLDLSQRFSNLATLNRFVKQLQSVRPDQKKDIRELSLLANLKDILLLLQRSIAHSADSITYIGPTRATGERYYRMQELAVDRIDPRGANLAMFLHSLSTPQLSDFSNWLATSIGYNIRVEKSGGHLQIELSEIDQGQFFNMADMGYGFSQVLPILAQVWSRSLRKAPAASRPQRDALVVMEQPELHLHPAYQARLADVFTSAALRQKRSERSDLQMNFIIETHSEAMINRLGEIIYQNGFPSEDVAIFLFEKNDDSTVTLISKATFDETGRLVNWPVGFLSY